MGIFLFSMIMFGALARYVHGRFFVRMRHTTRVAISTVVSILSFILIAIACMNAQLPSIFWLAVCGSIFTGVSSSFGEAIFLGFLKSFPSYMIGYTSMGTGAAGIFGTVKLLVANTLRIPNYILFLAEAPTFTLYYFAFRWLENRLKMFSEEKTESSVGCTLVSEGVPAGDTASGDDCDTRESTPTTKNEKGSSAGGSSGDHYVKFEGSGEEE